MATLPPIPLDRSMRPGGYSTTSGATNPFGAPTSLLELLSGLVPPAPAARPMSPAQQQVTPGSPAAAGGPVQSYSARIDPLTPAMDANGKSGALDPHQGGGLLGNMFGWNGNPIYEAVKSSNILSDIGYGLSTETNFSDGLAAAARRSAEMAPERNKERQALDLRRKYTGVIGKMGPEYRELAAAVESGVIEPQDAYWKALELRRDVDARSKTTKHNQSLAAMISDPQLSALVADGALDFRSAYDMSRGAVAKPTDDMQEFEAARESGYAGTFADWMGKKPVGSAGGGSGAPPREMVQANLVVDDIDRALGIIKSDPGWTTGMGAQVTGWMGGGKSNDVGRLLDSVRSNAGFDELQAMREASPTGGALGSITERELAMLQSTIGSLDQSQSAQQLADNLIRVRNAYLDVIHGPGSGPPRELASFEGGNVPQVSDQATYDALPSGASYRAPDGSVRRKP